MRLIGISPDSRTGPLQTAIAIELLPLELLRLQLLALVLLSLVLLALIRTVIRIVNLLRRRNCQQLLRR